MHFLDGQLLRGQYCYAGSILLCGATVLLILYSLLDGLTAGPKYFVQLHRSNTNLEELGLQILEELGLRTTP